jgi:DNA-binding LacI/PurR family transcriptional regulator
VSSRTVSNVVNGYRYVSEATRAKVKAAIEGAHRADELKASSTPVVLLGENVFSAQVDHEGLLAGARSPRNRFRPGS